MRSHLSVLHLVGSWESDYFQRLSTLYARDVITPEGFAPRFLALSTDRRFRLGRSLDSLGAPFGLDELQARIRGTDLVVSHLFCKSGMGAMRALFEDVLGLPLIGPRADTAMIATDKVWTRGIAAECGVAVADGVRVARTEAPDAPPLPLPLIVKPVDSDNSEGLSLVRDPSDWKAALAGAFAHGDDALVERFVAGREIRACVVERRGELFVPAVMEYPLRADCPIREAGDKLAFDADGLPVAQTRRAAAKPVLPAPLTEAQREAVAGASRCLHRALGARHYSLFDFRLEAGTDRVVLLEAGLFWAFSRISMISAMLAASGLDVAEEIGALWRGAVGANENGADVPARAVEALELA